jgi:hypothetical protein
MMREVTVLPNGGPAYPSDGMGFVGMSLRDVFAMHALTAVVTATGYDTHKAADLIADDAYKVADEMLKARAK